MRKLTHGQLPLWDSFQQSFKSENVVGNKGMFIFIHPFYVRSKTRTDYFDKVNFVWQKVFCVEVQQILDTFELRFGKEDLPISFRLLRHSFTNLTAAKVGAYKSAVIECSEDILRIQQNENEIDTDRQRLIRGRLQELKDHTHTYA